MPRPLLARCQPECIREYRAAARQRHQDGCALAAAGRRTAAIYLWGYTAEMVLKAAYFQAIGFSDSQHIQTLDLRNAVATAPGLGVVWPPQGQFHNVYAWAQLLVATRAATPGLGYGDPRFASRVEATARVIWTGWRETLRYHKNVAYLHEVTRAREAVHWLLMHSAAL